MELNWELSKFPRARTTALFQGETDSPAGGEESCPLTYQVISFFSIDLLATNKASAAIMKANRIDTIGGNRLDRSKDVGIALMSGSNASDDPVKRLSISPSPAL